MLNIFLNEMGIYQSEIGFPFTNHEANYINANLELAQMGVLQPILLSGWCRAVTSDIEKSLKLTQIKHLNLSLPVSPLMIKSKFNGQKNRQHILQMMVESLSYAQEQGVSRIGIGAEDASRADLSFLIELAAAAKEGGAIRLRYCDTLGYETPFTIYERVNKIAQAAQIDIEIHCHNDLGMAVACSVAGRLGAIDAGVNAYVNTCVNGVGERAGNADLVTTILALR